MPPAPTWQDSIRVLGAARVVMAFGEMGPAPRQRAIEGVELAWNNIPGGRFNGKRSGEARRPARV